MQKNKIIGIKIDVVERLLNLYEPKQQRSGTLSHWRVVVGPAELTFPQTFPLKR